MSVVRARSVRFALVASILGCLSVASAAVESDLRLWAEDLNDGTVADRDTAVTVNDRPVHLAFDSGTSLGLLLFEPALKRLKLKMSVEAPDVGHTPGRVRVGATEPCVVGYFGSISEDVVLPIAQLPNEVVMFSDEELDGVIGWAEMRVSVWLFELAEGSFSQYPEVPAEIVKGWTKLPLSDKNGTLSFVLSDDAHGVKRIIVDTGNSGGILLPPDQWREWKEKNGSAPMTLETNYLSGQGIRYAQESWAEEFTLGSLTLKQVAISPADPTYYRVQADPGEKIIAIGLAALARMDVFVDGPNHIAYLRASASPPPAYLHNRMGVVFVPRDEKSNDLLAHVVPNGPAADAGIHEGDLLVKMNQLDISGWRTHSDQARSITGRVAPGVQKHYTLQRGTEIVEVDVTAKNLLGPMPSSFGKLQALTDLR